jgi:HK97 family phage major capsid protein
MSADGYSFECVKWQKSTSWKDGLTKPEIRKEAKARKESEKERKERREAFFNFMRTGRTGFQDYLKYGLDGPGKEISDADKSNANTGEILIPQELEDEIMRCAPQLTILRSFAKR